MDFVGIVIHADASIRRLVALAQPVKPDVAAITKHQEEIMHVTVVAVDRPEVPPLKLSPRFRHDVTYFAAHPTDLGRAALPAGEYYIVLAEAAVILDDGVFRIISPLDSDNRTELEITEEQEDWLRWVVEHKVEHIRLEST